ncbi:MAG: ferredoxin-type protein NapF [Psychromonas sp.]|nr:ferredoxin-type protein NapF [Psychromonas sp.]
MQFNANKRNLFRRSRSNSTYKLLPWIKSVEQFLTECTQCGDCQSACPEKIIIRGDGGFPAINFDLGECNFCGECANSCSLPLFNTISSIPWTIKAVIADDCLANKSVYCRSCAESCEPLALSFKIGISAVPKIDLSLCNGCGACVATCPTKSITLKEAT